MDAINQFVSDFIEQVPASKGKVKVAALLEALKEDEVQEKLKEVVSANLPKQKRNSPKKLKDPKAPKRPKSAYMFYCDANRERVKEQVLEENPDAKLPEVTRALADEWNAIKNDAKKSRKYVKLATKAKDEYDEAKAGYKKPSDEELAKLPCNQGKSGKSGTKRKKKDPDAPKHPTSAFLYFSKDHRAEIGEETGLKGVELSTEVGRVWREEYKDTKKAKKYMKAAAADKVRWEREKAAYVPAETSDEDEEAAAPKKKRGRPKGSKNKKPEPEPVEDDDDDEVVEVTPKRKHKSKSSKSKSKSSKSKSASKRRTKVAIGDEEPVVATEKVLFGSDAEDSSDDEE